MRRLQSFHVAFVAVATVSLLLSGCSGGGDDTPPDAPAKTDLIALVTAAFEETPRLPSGIELIEVTSEPGWSSQNVAVLDFLFKEKGLQHHAVASIYRSERDAREELDAAREMYQGEEAKSARGSYCYWDEGAFYLDVKAASSCYGLAGVVYLEVESGPAKQGDTAPSLELLKALQRHFNRLAEHATERVRTVPPKPLAALLSSVPPPAAGVKAKLQPPTISEGSDTARNFGLVRQVGWPSDAQDHISAYIAVFNANTGAEEYKKDFFGTGNTAVDGDASCASVQQRVYRVCLQVVEETVIQAQRVPEQTTSPSLDKPLVTWLAVLAGHVENLRAGRLPAAPEREPAAARTAPATATRAGRIPTTAPTPTRTPSPPITRINAGTWTFDLVITANNCSGGLLPVGSTMRAVYELTDSNGDGFIDQGEGFSIYQSAPFEQHVGDYVMNFPGGSIQHPAVLGNRTGYAVVVFTFTKINEALIDYQEVYPGCTVSAR